MENPYIIFTSTPSVPLGELDHYHEAAVVEGLPSALTLLNT